MNRFTLVFLLLCSVLTGCQSYFDRAEKYSADQDYDSAFEYYQKAADTGDMRAWNSLGVAYCQGRGTPVNYAKAFISFAKGAQAKLPGAICNLGHCYRYGYGVERDMRKAEEYYRQAASTQMPQAVYNLGLYYLEQQDAPTQQAGFELLLKCANANYVPALLQLAMCFINGAGVEKDQFEGAVWLLIASRQNDDEAKAASKMLLDIAKSMTPEAINKVKARADAFRNDHAIVSQ